MDTVRPGLELTRYDRRVMWRRGGSPDQHVRRLCPAFSIIFVVAAGCSSGPPGTPLRSTTGAHATAPSTVVAATARATLPPATPGSDTAGPNAVAGSVVDTGGQPLAGAHLWAEVQAVYGTPARADSGTDGHYRIGRLLDQLIYRVHAWRELRYDGRDWCLQLAPSPHTGSAAFGGRDGAQRDFQWQLSGPVEGSSAGPLEDGAFWGGTIRLMPSFSDGNYKRVVQITLTPIGSLADGTPGATITRSVDYEQSVFALDIPLGRYRVTAAIAGEPGSPTALLVAQTGGRPAPSAEFSFKPESFSSCGSASTSTGIARGFLDVVLP